VGRSCFFTVTLLVGAGIVLASCERKPPQADEKCQQGAEASRPADTQAVFDTRPYAEAKQAAERQKRWFIVRGTATWCPPCRKMESTTWKDQRVVKWVQENAIAVSVDIDKHKELARELSIDAVPAVIAFREGREFDRVVGYRDAQDFLGWLEGIARGQTSIDSIRQQAGTRESVRDAEGIEARLQLARALANAGRFEEAADEYVWLWDNMLKYAPAMSAVRASFMASDMQRLAQRHEQARRGFIALRDRLTPRVEEVLRDNVLDREAVGDWITLNETVGDAQATLSWFDRAKGEPGLEPLLQGLAYHLEDVLVRHQRWADVLVLYPEPLKTLEFEYSVSGFAKLSLSLYGDFSEQERKELEELQAQRMRDRAGLMYAAMLAANRADAEDLAERACELDTSDPMRVALVSWALRAGQPRAHHLQWLEKAAKTSSEVAELRAELERALGNKP
jgi:thioredoxin 1